jgi:FkbM family methyltransferase
MTASMRCLNVFQKILEFLPIRGKGRLADIILQSHRPDELECHPLRDVTVFLNPGQRIERWMWAGAYERDLVALFKSALKPGMTVLDVGANIGYFSAIAAGLVGSEGSVHAFEPTPECFARLQRNLSSFPWSHAYPCAVGDTTGAATIHFNERELGWGSLLSDNDLTHAVDVPLISLDDSMLREGISSAHFIKMDVEGGEYRALQGAARILHDLRPIIAAELNSVCLSRDHHTPQDVVQLLQSAEYQTFSFNDGVLAIPRENGHALLDLRACTKNPFVR